MFKIPSNYRWVSYRNHFIKEDDFIVTSCCGIIKPIKIKTYVGKSGLDFEVAEGCTGIQIATKTGSRFKTDKPYPYGY